MANIPAKVRERLAASLEHYHHILASAAAREANEADTANLIRDVLCEMFGYDKFSEITSEYAIRGTYCDLAINIDNELEMLIEVKAVGVDLKETHVKQATDYAANKGIEWVVLTNGVIWRIFHMSYGQAIEKELLLEINLLEVDGQCDEDIDKLFLLAKEGIQRSALAEYHIHRRALDRYAIGTVILTQPILKAIRRELRRLSPDVPMAIEELENVIRQEVLKRDVVEGEEAEAARKKTQRALERIARKKEKKAEEEALAEDQGGVSAGIAAALGAAVRALTTAE